jgi:hypothetical protein
MATSMDEIKLKVNLRVKAVELALRFASKTETMEEILWTAEQIYKFGLIDFKDVADKP